MMRWIVESSVKFRLLVLVSAAVVMFLSVTLLRNTPVDVLPEFSATSVEVQTEALGLSAAEVEQLITVPLEADLLNGVPWLETIRSESVPGLSSILLVFEPGTDSLRARQVVNERITQARALPNVSKPPVMLQTLSSDSRVMMIGLTPRSLSLIDASVLARWTIRPRLMGVPGVANVATWGQRDQQLQVLVDPKRLQAKDVSLLQVIQTAGNAMWVSPLSFLEASTPGTGGFIDTTNQRLGIQHVSPIVSPATLAQVTVEDTPDRVLRLGDVATVVTDHQPLIGDAADNGNPGLILVVEKLPGADVLEVTKGVDEALRSMAPGLSGMDVDTSIFRSATFIDMAIGNIGTWLLAGSVLLVLVIGLFLFAWRATVISVVAILLSLASAALVLHLAGATANTIVLAGLVIGIGVVVDDAIIDVEQIKRRLDEHRARPNARSTADIVLHASLTTRSAVIYSTAITLLAVLPVFFLGGQERALYQPLAVAYALAILASMVVALTVTPALSLVLLSSTRPARRTPASVRWLQGRSQRVLQPVLRRPRSVLVVTGILLLIGIAGVPFVVPALMPQLKDPNLLIQFDGPPGTSLPEMNRITAVASGELRSIPGVRNVGAHVGRAVLGDQVVNVNSGEMWVSLDPTVDYDTAVAAVRKAVHGYPGIRSQVLTPEVKATADILATSSDDITVRLFGQDIELLRTKADEVRAMLAGVDGVVNAHVELQIQEPTLVLEVNLAAAERFQIKPGDVRRAAATMLSGTEVGSLFEDQKVFEVIVRGTPETRDSLSSIRDVLVDTPTGGRVRLGDVADVRIASKPNVVKREDVSRRIDVTADVRGRSVNAATADVAQRLKQISFPLENHAELLGDSVARWASLLRVIAVAVASALGIFLLLQGAFGSWRLSAAVFLALPMALVGGVVAILVTGRVASLGSFTGLLLIFGVAARNSVTLIRHCQHLQDDEGEQFGPALVVRAVRERVGLIVATAVAVGLAVAPLLLLGNVAGLEILHPMAVVVLGGLVTSTLLSLLVVPALYLLFGSGHVRHTRADVVAD